MSFKKVPKEFKTIEQTIHDFKMYIKAKQTNYGAYSDGFLYLVILDNTIKFILHFQT